MKNGTIAMLSLLAGCSDFELRWIVEPVAPPVDAPPAGEPEVEVIPVQEPVSCGVVELVVVAATPSPAFQTDGVLELMLVPRDANGELVLDCDWSVSASSGDDIGVGVTTVVTVPVEAEPTVFALDLDSSGSMAEADPQMLRIPAAQDFIVVTEAARADNQYGVFTFPRENVAPFAVTEMLADFTDDASVAAEAVAQVGFPSGATPLYQSAIEVMEFQALTTAHLGFHRALVLFSDGVPTDTTVTLDDLLDVAAATGTTIHTVGLGVASQSGPYADPDAVGVMQALAFSTEGSYSAATDADDLEVTFANLAASLAGGHIVVTVVFTAPPSSGTNVTGDVVVEDLTGTWGFIAP